MKWLQLDPPSLAERTRTDGSSVPSLKDSVLRGMWGFTLVSLLGFAPWGIFGRYLRGLGEGGLYAVCALVFLASAGLFLDRLIMGPGARWRFYVLFVIAFTAYAAAWMYGWIGLRGLAGPVGPASAADVRSIAGLLMGTLFMGTILCWAFRAWRAWWKATLALFLLNAVGYFIGQVFEALLWTKGTSPAQITVAKMQWAVWYGLGLGAGLGLAFHACQAEARRLVCRAT